MKHTITVNKTTTFKNFLINFINLSILLILMLYVYFQLSTNRLNDEWIISVSIISIALFFYHIIILLIKQYKIIDFIFIFVILSYIFQLGQIWVISSGNQEFIFWEVIFRYSENIIYEAALYSVVYIHSIVTGLVFLSNKRSINNHFSDNYSEKANSKSLYITGKLLFLISLPFRLYIDYYTLAQTLTSGNYSGTVSPIGPMNDIAILFIPSIVMIITSKYKSKKRNSSILFLIIGYLSLVMIFSGDRRYNIIAIIALLFTFIYVYNIKFTKKNIILSITLGVSLLNLLTIIRETRQYTVLSLQDFIVLYFNSFSNLNPILETLSEFGLTFLSLAGAIKLIPDLIPYQMGMSFIGSIPSILPIGWLFPGFFNRVSIGGVINSMTGYPVGTSVVTEMYANFGWGAFIFVFLLGVLLSKIFKKSRQNLFLTARYYSLFYILLNIIRSSTLEIFRHSIIIYIIPTLVFYYTLTNRNKDDLS